MDRSVLESDPQRVLEGMALAAYAVGAEHGYIYVRAEYPLAIKRLRTAIGQAERANFLGAAILESTVQLPRRDTRRRRRLRVRRGDGADRLGGGPSGHTATPPALPGRGRAVAPTDADQQRRDVRQHRPDHPQRRRLVRRRSGGRRAPDEGVRARRTGGQLRARRGAAGHHAAARSCSTSAVASSTVARSKRCRPVAHRAGASRRITSTCPSITSRSPRSARSWVRAA